METKSKIFFKYSENKYSEKKKYTQKKNFILRKKKTNIETLEKEFYKTQCTTEIKQKTFFPFLKT